MGRRMHNCPYPGCETRVAAWAWGCRTHFKILPADLADRLMRTKHWWPEYQPIKREADAFARKHYREQHPAEPRTCERCGSPASDRFATRICVPCHIALITGDKS